MNLTHNLRQTSRILRLGLVLAGSLIWFIGLILALGSVHRPGVALAQSPMIRYVAAAPVGNDNSNTCLSSSAPCATIQYAVDVANPNGEIRVATGTYTDVQARAVISQVVYISQTITIRGGYTTSNWAESDPVANPTTLDAQGQGRVFYITGNISPTIAGLRLTGGNAAGLGGGPFAEDFGGGIYVVTASLTLNDSQIFSNTAHAREVGQVGSRGRGGGAFFFNSFGATLRNNIFSGNNATSAGGLYFYNSSDVTLNNTTISNNLANHLGSGTKNCGGLLFTFSNDVTLMNNTISGNSAANSGGGICLDNTNDVVLTGNQVVSNTRGASFAGNGIGLHIANSKTVSLASNKIINNKGDEAIPGDIFGGGLYISANSIVTLTGNIISSNQASSGGGLYLANSDGTLTNNAITDNQALAGSGLYIQDSSPRLWHTTIARNSGGDGTGVHLTGAASTVALTNTILSGHTVGITVTAGNIATLDGVLWHDNTDNTGGAGTITITNEYTGDPAFAVDGYHLTFSSAAIDKGVDAQVTVDIDGDQRPCQLAPDLGADEINCLYLPIILKSSG